MYSLAKIGTRFSLSLKCVNYGFEYAGKVE